MLISEFVERSLYSIIVQFVLNLYADKIPDSSQETLMI